MRESCRDVGTPQAGVVPGREQVRSERELQLCDDLPDVPQSRARLNELLSSARKLRCGAARLPVKDVSQCQSGP